MRSRLLCHCGSQCCSQRTACAHRGAQTGAAAAAHIDILPPHGSAIHPHRIAHAIISGAARFIFSVYIIPSISLILSLRPSAASIPSEPACRPASRRTHHFPASLAPHTPSTILSAPTLLGAHARSWLRCAAANIWCLECCLSARVRRVPVCSSVPLWLFVCVCVCLSRGYYLTIPIGIGINIVGLAVSGWPL